MVADLPGTPTPALPPSPGAPGTAPSPLGAPPRVNCLQLMQGGKELEIEHAGAIYRLRITAMGKLILTK